jgi:hypothetical protein
MTDPFVLTLLTDDPALARRADRAGIDRIGLDLERLRKLERQAGTGSRISEHDLASLPMLRDALQRARLFVRTNPMHEGLAEEVEAAIDRGAEVLMLPMVRTVDEARRFASMACGRVHISLLVETPEAVASVGQLARVDGVHEIHIGLNDLRLSLGLPSHFSVLASPLLEGVAAEVHAAGLRFGVGGVGRYGDASLPIPPDLVYAQYPRLGADRAWVARSFLRPDPGRLDLAREVAVLRARMEHWRSRDAEALRHARDRLRALACGL